MKKFLNVVAILLIIGGSWFLYSQTTKGKETLPPEGIKTEKVIRGPIEALVTATGNLQAEEERNLSFSIAGQVAQVLVSEGEQVAKGQLLAKLDTDELELGIKQAQAALKVSQAQLAKVRRGPLPEELDAAQAALEAAEANLEDLLKGVSELDKQIAQLRIEQAKDSLWGAQGNRDALLANPMASEGSKVQAKAQVASAEMGVKIAELEYKKLLEPPKASALKAAESQIAQAKATLAKLQILPHPEDVALAEAQLEQAKVNLEIAQKKLEDALLTAPIKGYLGSWQLHEGDLVSPGVRVGTIIDTSKFHLNVSVDETEIGQIRVGQPVRIYLDAFPDDKVTGRVSQISLIGKNVQGLIMYDVRIDLDPTELELRPMMTGEAEIITNVKTDALLVPNRALRRDEKGKYVMVLENGQTKQVYIRTGTSNDRYTEVLSGLKEGQQIIIGGTSTPTSGNIPKAPFGGRAR